MDMYVNEKLTETTLGSILRLLSKVLPKPNRMPKTLYTFFQFVEKKVPQISTFEHRFCKNCRSYRQTDCLEDVCESCKTLSDTGRFFELDISSQIQFLFEYRKLAEILIPFQIRKDKIISDVKDGHEYIRVNSRTGRGPYDLTLMVNTDGLSLVKSSKSHCWPLMFMILEVPEHLREHFLIITGVWYDANIKPLMNTFLRPFCEKMNDIFNHGINWTNPKTNQLCTTRIVAPLFCADAPARADILNMQNHNGTFGCNCCEIKTTPCEKVKVKGKHNRRIYAYSEQKHKLRTKKRMKKQAKAAGKIEKKRMMQRATKAEKLKEMHLCKGIKGESIISSLPLVDESTCVLSELLHLKLLGIAKQFLKTWTKKAGAWNIKNKKNDIESFIAKIRPPSWVPRLPRSIFDFAFFKAHEFLHWVLYFSLPTLIDSFSDSSYLQHWMLFVIATFILLKNEITETELQQADICLRMFVRDIETLYSNKEYTYNVHQLLHAALFVSRWGPSYLTSAFPFEKCNGLIAKSVHGSKNLGTEIIKKIKMTLNAKYLRSEVDEIKSTINIQQTKTMKNFKFLGRAHQHKLTVLNDIEKILLSAQKLCMDNLSIYARACINGGVYTSQIYKETKTNNSVVKIKLVDNSIIYASIRFFVPIDEIVFIMIQTLSVESHKKFVHEETGLIVDHIIPVRKENSFKLLKLASIESIHNLIEVGNYVCDQPNQYMKNKVM